jgi:ABC-2 type transport system ATP-binding protein
MGKTILVSSHILPELEELCTWVGFIDRGRMVAVGPMEQIRDRVVTGRRLRIDLVTPDEPTMRKAEEVLKDRAGVLVVDLLGDHIEVTVEEQVQDSELLAFLIRRKLPVRSFAPVAGDLSEAFMRLTGPSGPGGEEAR